MTEPVVASYYDRLTLWSSIARHFGYGGGRDTLTVHRALADPKANFRPTTTRLHDVLIERLGLTSRSRVLDAGCGFGGTLLELASRTGARGTGVTLSPAQAAIGREAASRQGLSGHVKLHVGSYDHPPRGPFDVILAIESMAHSDDPAVTLAVLIRELAPDGTLVIVDDMPEPEARGSPDLGVFQDGWSCPVLWGRSDYLAWFQSMNVRLVDERDLTTDIRPRPPALLAVLRGLNRLGRALVPVGGVRQVLDSHLGGLALERLIARGLMRYRLLTVARNAR